MVILRCIAGTLDIFSMREKTQSYNMTELISIQDEIEEHIEGDLVPAGVRIHSLVTGSFNAVGISKVTQATV